MLIYLPKEEKEKEFVITKGGEAYLAVFEIEQWNLFAKNLNFIDSTNHNVRIFRRHFLGSAEQVETNEEAVIVIPDVLCFFCTAK